VVKGITYILTNNAGVRAAVGRNNADNKYKAYPVICPQPETWPYSVVRQSGRVPFGECKQGQGTMYEYTYDVFSFHKNYEEAEALDNAVVTALKGVDGTHNGVEFTEEIRHLNTVDGDFVIDPGLYVKISSFQTVVDES
jgi:hypothetical protein